MTQVTLERAKATAQATVRQTEQGVSATADGLRELSLNIIDMAHANIESAFEFAREAATARTPGDAVNLWAKHTRKQLDLLSEQSKKLTELGQKFVAKSAPSIAPTD